MKIVITTEKDSDSAYKLADQIIDKKLGGCVQCISNIQSKYFWKDKIVNDTEILLIIKTINEKVNVLKEFLKENHSYQIPEIILIDVDSLTKDYSDWIQNYLR